MGAFEWTPRDAGAWITGRTSGRWPVAGGEESSAQLAVAQSRPWGWPGVGARSARVSFGGRLRGAGAVAQLQAAGYREVRWTTAICWSRLPWVWTVAASALELTAGGGRQTGHELALGATYLWNTRAYVDVVALGAWRSPGAVELGVPTEFQGALGWRSKRWLLEGEWHESPAGGAGRLGARLALADRVWFMGAVAALEPRLRAGLQLQQGLLSLTVSWLVHAELPTTRAVGIRVGR